MDENSRPPKDQPPVRPPTQDRRYQPYHPPDAERRKKPDWMVRSIQWFNACAWVLVAFILANVAFSVPAKDNYITLFKGLTVSGTWNTRMLGWAQYFLMANVVICLTGLIVNALRLRRKGDRISRGLIIAGVLSILAMVGLQLMLASL